MNYRILVTGGAGYIGSVLVPELLNEGWSVTVLDSFVHRVESLARVRRNPRLRIVRGDVRDERVLRPLIREADLMLPLAALVGAPLCDRNPEAARTINRDAVVRMLGLMRRDQGILFPTTNSGYGVGRRRACTEKSLLRPLSLYARLKVETERIVLERKNALSFRLATAFGLSPRMRWDLLVNDFTYRAVVKGHLVLFESHFRRNFIHVQDIARVIVHGIRRFSDLKGEAYNVGLSDANISKRELCERIRRQVPGFVFSESPSGRDPDRRDYIVSNAKMEATGFRPSVSLDDGIAEMIRELVAEKRGHPRVAR